MQRIPLFPLDERRQVAIPPGFHKVVDDGDYEEYVCKGTMLIAGHRICRIVVHKGNTSKTILEVMKEYKPITNISEPLPVNDRITCISIQYQGKTGLVYLLDEYLDQQTPYAHAELTEIINTIESDKRTVVPVLFAIDETDDKTCQEHLNAFRTKTSKPNLQKNRRHI